jgi:hypothetical protein
MMSWFRFEGKRYVEIDTPDGVIILTAEEFRRGVERTKKHIKQSKILGNG